MNRRIATQATYAMTVLLAGGYALDLIGPGEPVVRLWGWAVLVLTLGIFGLKMFRRVGMGLGTGEVIMALLQLPAVYFGIRYTLFINTDSMSAFPEIRYVLLAAVHFLLFVVFSVRVLKSFGQKRSAMRIG